MPWSDLLAPANVRRVFNDGTLASVASTIVMAWAGRRDTGSHLSAINAPSHWFWGERALRRNDASLRYTVVGALTHHASAVFWAVFYRLLRCTHRQPTAANAVTDAVAVTVVAAVVDLKLVPRRLTPGFERRLSRHHTAWVYVGFAAGLAIGGILATRHHRDG